MDTSSRATTNTNITPCLSRRQLLLGLRAAGVSGGLLLLAACSPSAPAPASSAPTQPAVPAQTAPTAVAKPAGGTLVAAGEAIGDNYMPAASFQGWAQVWVLNNIYETLYTFRDFKTLLPSLATGHTVSADGLTYTFQLRQGVTFHDGTPFNAAAVEFNYMRYLDKTHPFYDENAVYRTSILPGVKSVQAKDEHTVELIRDQPSAATVAALGSSFAGIMSPTAVKKAGVQDAGRSPVGTGPFTFEKAEKGNQASIRAFDGYWGGRPALDRVVVRVIADDQAMAASLLAGEVDITPFIDFKDLDSFRQNPKLSVQIAPAASTGYLALNQAHEAMRDLRVRQALGHAIDKQKIIDTIFYGQADVGAGLVPLPMWAYDDQLKDYYKFDRQQAQDLFKQAGGAPEFDLYTQSSGFWPRMAELLQADLNAAGCKVSIQKVDSAKFYGLVTEGSQAAFIGDGTYSQTDPEEIMNAFFGCSNPRSKRWGYCDSTFDQLMASQSQLQDQEKRKAVFFDMQKKLLDDVVLLSNYYNRFATISSKRVTGYAPVPIRYMFLDKVAVSQA